jgi:hypothetical protein
LESYQVKSDEGVTHYLLPARGRSKSALIVGFATLACSFVILGGLGWMLWRGFLLGAFHELFFVAIFAWGLWKSGWQKLRPGAAEVHVDKEILHCSDRFGYSRASWTISLRQVVRLEIEAARPSLRRPLVSGARLAAEFASGARLPIVQQYPRTLLERLANDLRPFVAAARKPEEDLEQSAPPDVPVVDVSGIPEGSRDVMLQPEDSEIIAAHEGDTHTYILQRWGMLNTRARYIAFNVLALIFAVVPVLILIYLAGQPAGAPGPAGPIFWWFSLGTLACILVAMVAALQVYTRRGVLIVARGADGLPSLTRMTRGMLRSSERVWRRNDIRYITCEPHGSYSSFQISVKDEKRFRIILKGRSGRACSLLDTRELDARWLATELRELLGVPNRHGQQVVVHGEA